MPTIRTERPKEVPKCDRALDLHERGLSIEVIAERLGISNSHASEAIKKGKIRRQRALAESSV